MFIQINVRFKFDDTISNFITSNPNDAFLLINVLDKSDKVIAWNMNEYKPENFGMIIWMKWYKYNDNLFE